MFSNWGDDFDRKNSVFTVEVVNAMDAKGNKIAAEFSKNDEERLSSLIKSRTELEAKLKNQ